MSHQSEGGQPYLIPPVKWLKKNNNNNQKQTNKKPVRIDGFIPDSCCPGLSWAGDRVECSMQGLEELIIKISREISAKSLLSGIHGGKVWLSFLR